MKRLLLILPLILISCSQNDDLKFPNSSFGKAMQCTNTNYYAFFEKMTGDSASNLRDKVGEYCLNEFSLPVDESLYTGTANLKKDGTKIKLSPSIQPKDESKILNHLLATVSFVVSLQSEVLKDGECVPATTFLEGTAVATDGRNTFSSSVIVENTYGDSIQTLISEDNCFKNWINDSATDAYGNFLNPNSSNWTWYIKSAKGLYFDK